MKFRDWINEEQRRVDEINRGLQRQFRSQNPHVPIGVMKDIEHQRLGNMWRQSQPYMKSNAQGDTASATDNPYADTLAMPQNPAAPQGKHDSVSGMMQDEKLTSITNASWEQKPRVIEITPMSFDERTTQLFHYFKFGFNHVNEIDQERHERAAQFVKERGEKNQPVVVMQLPDGKYQLQEGFHRTMQYLLSGAPRDHWFALKSGEPVSAIDLSQWKPVRLRAFVGHPDGQRQSLQGPPSGIPMNSTQPQYKIQPNANQLRQPSASTWG